MYAMMLSAQYQAGGLLFGVVGGMPYPRAVLLVAGITTLYTVLGGMYSNAYVGVLKAVLLLGSYALAVPLPHFCTLAASHELGQALTAIDPRLKRQLVRMAAALPRYRWRSDWGWRRRRTRFRRSTPCKSKRATRLAIGYSFLFQACIGIGVLLFGLSMRVAMPFLPAPDLATPVLGMSVLPTGDRSPGPAGGGGHVHANGRRHPADGCIGRLARHLR